MRLGKCKTLLQAGLLLFYIRLSLSAQTSADKIEKISVGAIFDHDTEEVQNVFKFAMTHQNVNATRTDPSKAKLETQAYVDVINTADAFKLSKLSKCEDTGVALHTVCNQFARGVLSMLGAVTADSFETLHSYTNTFKMPFVTPWFPEKVIPPSSGSIDHAISMRPNYHKAVVDTIIHYGWTEIIYLYDSHDGLLRLQQIYQTMHPSRVTFRITVVKRINNASDAIDFLLTLEQYDRWGNKHIVLDCNTRNAKNILVGHVRNVQLGRRTYHYLLSGLVMDDPWEHEVVEYGAVNITGFRIVDHSRKTVRDFTDRWIRANPNFKNTISAEAALMYDGVTVLIDALGRLYRKKNNFAEYMRRAGTHYNSTKECNPSNNWFYNLEYGEKILKSIKRTEMEGLTGNISFNDEGHRQNYTVDVVEMSIERAMVKVAVWSDRFGFLPVSSKQVQLYTPTSFVKNKTYHVVTLLQEPYMMQRPVDDYVQPGNDQFYGLCKDIMEIISQELGIKYELYVVKDGQYGSPNTYVKSVWDGLMGDLTRKDADIALASLAVTKERANAVDFSQPFVSIAFPSRKNAPVKSSDSFSFLRPLSKEIWLCILFSFFAVSIVLFLVSRFSPQEWKSMSVTETNMDHTFSSTNEIILHNEFSIWNSFWFSLGSFMQQGSDVIPRSLSGRIVVSVWWFFALILVCSYTANLSANLVSKRLSDKQSSYARVPGTIVSFTETIHIINANNVEEDSLDDIDVGNMGTSKYIVSCDKTKEDCKAKYIHFALAVQKDSPLREAIDLVLINMKKSGYLKELMKKWVTHPEEKIPIDDDTDGSEINLGEVAGIFYVLLGGIGLALVVALLDFCQNGRAEAARANVPLRAALRAKAKLTNKDRKQINSTRTPTRDQERMGWNGSAFSGYYSGNHQSSQDEAVHSSFTHV